MTVLLTPGYESVTVQAKGVVHAAPGALEFDMSRLGIARSLELRFTANHRSRRD